MKKFIAPLCLTGLFILLILLVLPEGCVYGSDIDWLSQHAALAETIRTACLEQGSLLPSFLPLGGGSNGFQFAYYGYLRPDILIGCLLPSVPMYQILIVYSLAGYLAAVLLFYLWLRRQELPVFDAFFGGVLFLTASCFFHTHRQLMFINYMPFLLLALLSIQKSPKKLPPLLPLWMLLICLHSFYYAPASFLVLGWYWFWQSGKSFFKPWFLSSALAGCMSAALLLPTGLSILEHRRASSGADTGLLTFFPDFKSLLYSSYGIGLTLLALYLLLLGLSVKAYRKVSLLFLLLLLWGGASYLLNATLYARAKILIPFLPLLLLHVLRLFSELRAGQISWRLWPFLPLLAVAWQYLSWKSWPLVLADVLILLTVVIVQKLLAGDSFLPSRCADAAPKRERRASKAASLCRQAALFCLLVTPCLFYLRAASKEDFVTKETLTTALAVPDYTVDTGSLYRYDSLKQPMTKSNMDASSTRRKSSMYSSVYSAEYSEVWYDLLKTPIQINNRLAILPANNPFLLYFMGIRYVETAPEQVPDGYQILWQNEETAVSENENALPMAYLSSDTLSETDFDALTGWEQAEALTRYTIVPETESETGERKTVWSSMLQEYTPAWSASKIPASVEIRETDGGYELHVSNESELSLSFDETLTDKLLLLEFEVENETEQAVIITINGVKNKLSAGNAAYPNGNETFHYEFLTTSEEGLHTLDISLSKGSYTVKNIRFSMLDASVFSEKEWTSVEALDAGSGEILACRATASADTWFVTSIPMQEGMTLLVDGEPVELVTVNKAFAGARLSTGEHEIRLLFEAPGKHIGIWLSAAGAALWLGWVALSRRPFPQIKKTVDKSSTACI